MQLVHFPATANIGGQSALRQIRRSTASIFAVFLLLLDACSTYSAKDAPHPVVMPYRHQLGPLSLGVDAYTQPSRQEEVFGEDLTKIAVLPVHVVVSNTATRPVVIAAENFELALPGKQSATPRPSFEIAGLLAPELGVADYATAGVGMLGGLGGAIGAVAGRMVSYLGAAALGWSRDKTLQARGEDYDHKSFKPVRLAQGQSAEGFLFFVIPPGTPPFNDALLRLSAQPNENENLTLTITMTGLGYKGLPAAGAVEPPADRAPTPPAHGPDETKK